MKKSEEPVERDGRLLRVKGRSNWMPAGEAQKIAGLLLLTVRTHRANGMPWVYPRVVGLGGERMTRQDALLLAQELWLGVMAIEGDEEGWEHTPTMLTQDNGEGAPLPDLIQDCGGGPVG